MITQLRLPCLLVAAVALWISAGSTAVGDGPSIDGSTRLPATRRGSKAAHFGVPRD